MLPSDGRHLPPGTWRSLGRIVVIGEVRRQWQHAIRKIAMYPPQQFDQLLSVVFGEAGKGLGTDLVREVQYARQDRPGLIGQNEASGAPVARLGLPLDPAVFLHAVDLPHQGHRLDFEQVGEGGLIDPLVPREIAEHLALRASESQEKQRALIEPAPEQPGDVVNEKTEAAVEVHATPTNTR